MERKHSRRRRRSSEGKDDYVDAENRWETHEMRRDKARNGGLTDRETDRDDVYKGRAMEAKEEYRDGEAPRETAETIQGEARGGREDFIEREHPREASERSRGRGREGRDYRDRENHSEMKRKRDREGYVRNGHEGRDWKPEKEASVRHVDNGEVGRDVKEKVVDRIIKGEGEGEQVDEKNAGRSGGVYVPPFKLAQMMKDMSDKSSVQYQRLTWDALRKSINGLVNKVNASNIKNILPELFAENLIRGRGLFARSCIKSQMASPSFTHVFAALVAVVNTKFPELGELLLKRIILQLRRAFKRNDKPVLLAAAKFVAHLVNQQVAHEILSLELLTLLLEKPTDDSVEVAVGFVKECGALLQDLSPQGLHGIFERFRGILHEGEIDKRVQFMIEGLFAIRKTRFQGFPAVMAELDLVDQDDQITHELSLEDELDQEISLDIFNPDPDFLENEKKYEAVRKDILGEESDHDLGADDAEKDSGDDEDSEDDSDEEDEEEREARMQIQDETETNLVNLRRTIYLTIMSSVDFEEAGHKLLKIKLEPGQEMELCVMLLECCSQERTYLRYYGLLGQRFCMINRVYQENFDDCFVKQYSMIHRLETNKLRNVAKFFAHLLGTDALPWQALAYIRLTEEDTTSSSRIFIKILFQTDALLKSIKGIVPVPLFTNFESLEAEPKAQALLGPSYWTNRTQQMDACVKGFLEDIWKTRINVLYQGKSYYRRQPLTEELSEHLGLRKLNERLSDPLMQESFDGIFPKDNPKNTRFAINFFTSIGLGGLTDSLREYLKNMPRMIMNQHKAVESESDDAATSDTSGGGSSSDSEPESDAQSSGSESDRSVHEKRRKKK